MPRPARLAWAASTAALLLSTMAGCAADGAGSRSRHGSDTLTVFAAASLTEPFRAIATAFESTRPGVRVRLSFGPSSGLAQQVGNGAPADVFASASEQHLSRLVTAGEAEPPVTFARNRLVIAVPADNPARVSGLTDLGRPAVKVALCQRQVPCGMLAAQVLAAAGVSVRPVTEAPDVRAVLTLVRSGEVDAGLVYVSDVATVARDAAVASGAAAASGSAGAGGVSAGGASPVAAVHIPDNVNRWTSYPIAVLTRSRNAAMAREFVELVLSARGQAVLAAAGFAPS